MSGAGSNAVLVINSGSSSLKIALFELGVRPGGEPGLAERDGGERRVAEGAVTRMGSAEARAWLRAGNVRREQGGSWAHHAGALNVVLKWLDELVAVRPPAVGHRLVHGGPHVTAPARIDAELLTRLRAAVAFAPLHLPAAMAAIEAARARFPEVPQVACFDTAFHTTMPEIARRLPIPSALHDEGVRRYGFHGLSYEFVLSSLSSRAGEPLPARIVIAHLGSGASLVAVKDGKAIDTTMGFTPAGGVPMGTRTGDLDPGVLVYLARAKQLGPDAIERIVDRESGLLAVGGSSDMETLIDRSARDPGARLAIEMFGYAIRKAIGALSFALGGLDLLVFTGGIGEHVPEVRALACGGLEAFGVALDRAKNERGEHLVHQAGSPCAIRVMATDEERVIARHTYALLARAG
ncbi:acetate/propionate family kinase [Pendulispora albinea]|uniref:Acetate kinase n=1 Tax=Pendulispora albinea TaxID=2741071 RepID=A0ABZ2LMC6_9BACT